MDRFMMDIVVSNIISLDPLESPESYMEGEIFFLIFNFIEKLLGEVK